MRINFYDYIETLCEEMRLNGFDAKVVGKEIHIDTIAGKLRYHTFIGNGNIMADYYRFIMIYGGKLHTYGLEQKLLEESKTKV